MFTSKHIVLENVLLPSKESFLWTDQVPFFLLKVLFRCISEFQSSNLQFPFKLKMFEMEFKRFHCQFLQARSKFNKCDFWVKKFPFESNELKFFWPSILDHEFHWLHYRTKNHEKTQFMVDHTNACYFIQTTIIFGTVSICFFKFSYFTPAYSVQKYIVRMRNNTIHQFIRDIKNNDKIFSPKIHCPYEKQYNSSIYSRH